jgi:hypothetical protein
MYSLIHFLLRCAFYLSMQFYFSFYNYNDSHSVVSIARPVANCLIPNIIHIVLFYFPIIIYLGMIMCANILCYPYNLLQHLPTISSNIHHQ